MEKNNLKIKRKNLFDLFSEIGFSDYAKEDLKVKISEIDEKEKVIEKQMLELKGELEEIKNIESLGNEINEICRKYQRKIKNASFELRKYIVRKWIGEINIQEDGSIKIQVRVTKGEVPEKGNKEILYSQGNVAVNSIKFEELLVP